MAAGPGSGKAYLLANPALFLIASLPRWIALIGYVFALLLLVSGRYVEWIIMVFPLWVLLISIYILIDNFRRLPETPTKES